MAFEYGFYNSINGDRKYDATDFGKVFDGVIKDGVFESIGSKLFTTIGENAMEIVVGTGKAWFNHTWSLNTTPMVFEITQSHPVLSRYDTVVLEINEMADVYGRVNEIKVIEGTPSSNPEKPELTNNDNIHQYPLAHIKINPTVTTLTAADIEIVVGQEPCPFVTGILETADITGLFANWQSQFDTWFTNLKEQLTGDIVTNLQNQIDNCLKIADIATQADIDAGTEGKVITAPFFKNVDYKVGDILTTWRTDLGENWLLCNGDWLAAEDYPDLYKCNPGLPANILNSKIELAYANKSEPITSSVSNSVLFWDDIFIYWNAKEYMIVKNLLTGESVTIPTKYISATTVGGMAMVVDGIYYIFMVFSASNNTGMTVAICNGDPFDIENWILPTGNLAYISEPIAIIGEDYHFSIGISHNSLLNYHITFDSDGNSTVTADGSTTLPSLGYDNTSDTKYFVLGNRLYVIGFFGIIESGNWNYRFFIKRLSENKETWVTVYENPNATVSGRPTLTYSVKNGYAIIFSKLAAKILCYEFSYDENVTAKNMPDIDNDHSVIVQRQIDGVTLKYESKYYIFTTNNQAGEYLRIFIYDDITSMTTAPVDNFITVNYDGIEGTGKKIYSECRFSQNLIGCMMAYGRYIFAYPSFALPEISQSTTYTYIKAKEDAPNADQQADTPAS